MTLDILSPALTMGAPITTPGDAPDGAIATSGETTRWSTTDSVLVLSLFPGIGLLDRAFEERGFCVVRGPDQIWGGDIRRFHPPAGKFDGVIGGPPCQAFSRLRHMVKAVHGQQAIAENLIPEFERCVAAAQPQWFLMENVPDAPDPVVAGYAVHTFLLNNRWLGEEQERKRKISFGIRGKPAPDLRQYIRFAALQSNSWSPAVLASGSNGSHAIRYSGKDKPKKNRMSQKGGRGSRQTVAEALRLQGLPANFFDHSPLTVEGQQKVIGNGVPLPMGHALAQAVREALRCSTARLSEGGLSYGL